VTLHPRPGRGGWQPARRLRGSVIIPGQTARGPSPPPPIRPSRSATRLPTGRNADCRPLFCAVLPFDCRPL